LLVRPLLPETSRLRLRAAVLLIPAVLALACSGGDSQRATKLPSMEERLRGLLRAKPGIRPYLDFREWLDASLQTERESAKRSERAHEALKLFDDYHVFYGEEYAMRWFKETRREDLASFLIAESRVLPSSLATEKSVRWRDEIRSAARWDAIAGRTLVQVDAALRDLPALDSGLTLGLIRKAVPLFAAVGQPRYATDKYEGLRDLHRYLATALALLDRSTRPSPNAVATSADTLLAQRLGANVAGDTPEGALANKLRALSDGVACNARELGTLIELTTFKIGGGITVGPGTTQKQLESGQDSLLRAGAAALRAGVRAQERSAAALEASVYEALDEATNKLARVSEVGSMGNCPLPAGGVEALKSWSRTLLRERPVRSLEIAGAVDAAITRLEAIADSHRDAPARRDWGMTLLNGIWTANEDVEFPGGVPGRRPVVLLIAGGYGLARVGVVGPGDTVATRFRVSDVNNVYVHKEVKGTIGFALDGVMYHGYTTDSGFYAGPERSVNPTSPPPQTAFVGPLGRLDRHSGVYEVAARTAGVVSGGRQVWEGRRMAGTFIVMETGDSLVISAEVAESRLHFIGKTSGADGRFSVQACCVPGKNVPTMFNGRFVGDRVVGGWTGIFGDVTLEARRRY